MSESSRPTARRVLTGLVLAGPVLIACGFLIDLTDGLGVSRFAGSLWQWALLMLALGLAALLLEGVIDRTFSRGEMRKQRELADDLEALLIGTRTCDELRLKYERFRPGVMQMLPNLHHYLDDADIRGRNEAYRQMQEAELRTLIQLLREGASSEQLQQVQFLGPSQRITRPGRL